MAQVEAFRFRHGSTVLLKEQRLAEMNDWEWPLHMIDFETTAPALPFFVGMNPYETVAFQFSHHILHRKSDGNVRIEHATQWISTDEQTNPNIKFVRALRAALMPQGKFAGTVFRYHNHENTVLRALRSKIVVSDESDKSALLEFIDLITKPGGKEGEHGLVAGAKEMVDLHRLVQEGYYSKVAGGSISLKHILPAILHDAPEVAALFSRAGLFGGAAITSQNFTAADGHVWLQPAKGNDPYKTLPPIFQGEYAGLNEMLARLAGDDDEGAINHGGMAMTSWSFTQFADMGTAEREAIRNALLRYCELDTLAMVILVMGLFELRGRPLQLTGTA
jgi:hypothetical protein